MTPSELAADLKQVANRFDAASQQAVNEALEYGLKRAKAHSSGTLTPEQLRAADHPYARRHGSVRAPGRKDRINVETGEFRDAWEIEQAQEQGGRISGYLVNEDPKADWLLEGTDTMIGRDLSAAVEREIEPVLRRRLEAAMGRLFR